MVNAPRQQILIFLFAIGLFSCEKETTRNKDYVFGYPYQSLCSGILWVTVPNTFAPEYNPQGWFPSLVKYTSDSDCLMNLPLEIRTKLYQRLDVEVFDTKNHLWYKCASPPDSVIKTWNGRSRLDNRISPPGIYYWTYTLVDLDGNKHQQSGLLNILY